MFKGNIKGLRASEVESVGSVVAHYVQKLLEVKGFDPNGKVKIKNTCSIDLVNSVLEDMLQRARIIHSDEVYFCFGGIDGSQRVQFYSPRNELESLGTGRIDMRLEDQEISTSHLTFVDTEVVIPDSYEINDPSLDDIRDVLNPRFSKDQVLQPHKNQQCSSAVDGSNYLMFPENPSRLTTKYFLSLAPPRTLPSEDKFGPFSLGEPTLPPHQVTAKQPMYIFFRATKTHGDNNGEEDEHVHLNLKL
ncbi:hypothetical protein L2E82_05843 [Cichorium intybus]|uniref:Uncharacterized protein n=1 Tax=Cichorium intybus TaxID=13427 RepID=A0ACB9H9X4_CICIN|nr:hypothetical protein L2E82_05843 [Cichorium intybus]